MPKEKKKKTRKKLNKKEGNLEIERLRKTGKKEEIKNKNKA